MCISKGINRVSLNQTPFHNHDKCKRDFFPLKKTKTKKHNHNVCIMRSLQMTKRCFKIQIRHFSSISHDDAPVWKEALVHFSKYCCANMVNVHQQPIYCLKICVGLAPSNGIIWLLNQNPHIIMGNLGLWFAEQSLLPFLKMSFNFHEFFGFNGSIML